MYECVNEYNMKKRNERTNESTMVWLLGWTDIKSLLHFTRRVLYVYVYAYAYVYATDTYIRHQMNPALWA